MSRGRGKGEEGRVDAGAIVSGATSRTKRGRISGMTAAEAISRLT